MSSKEQLKNLIDNPKMPSVSDWVYEVETYLNETNENSEEAWILIDKIKFHGDRLNHCENLVALLRQLYKKKFEKKYVVSIETPALKCVDRKYICDIAVRANMDIDSGAYDSAITKSRTLLEEVFCYAIETRGETHVQNGKIKELYKQVKNIYSLSHSPELDVRVNELLSGLEKILTAITEMRNQASDSHGVGDNRIDINEAQARLFVNAALAMADYILSLVYLSQK